MENRIALIENGLVVRLIIATMEFANTLEGEKLDVTNIPCGVGYPVVNGIVGHPNDLLTEQELLDIKINEAKNWRNNELNKTDWVLPVIDHPQHAQYLTYRQALRDWTDTEFFPNTKPIF
jgi:hypothetical protein